MKALYNSEKGRMKRPRKTERKVGQMPRHLQNELELMGRAERTMFKITASLALINLGVDVLKLG